jgi:hypothetical protein
MSTSSLSWASLVTFSYELLNFMDGKRNTYDILREVQGEALSSNLLSYRVKDATEFVENLRASQVASY